METMRSRGDWLGAAGRSSVATERALAVHELRGDDVALDLVAPGQDPARERGGQLLAQALALDAAFGAVDLDGVQAVEQPGFADERLHDAGEVVGQARLPLAGPV